MTGALRFALLLTPEALEAPAPARQSAGAIAGLARPGDSVLLVDATGPGLGLPVSWPAGVEPEILRLDPGEASASAASARQRGPQPALLLHPGDLLAADGIASLRLCLEGGAEAVLANSALRITGAAGHMAAPDAHRWESPSPDPSRLWPRPRRLVLSPALARELGGAEEDLWERLLSRQRPQLCPAPVLLHPPPASRALSLCAAPHRRDAEAFDRYLSRLRDELVLLDPAEAEPLAEAAHGLMRTLPRGLRRQAMAAEAPLGPILAALAGRRPDRALALARLGVVFAARDRAETRAATEEIAALRRDLDIALPDAEYLLRTYERLYRG